MANPRQKRKLRSSISKAKRKPKSKKRILSNAIIAANWDKSQTLAQNYKRLGLTARLNKGTGGVEKTGTDARRSRDEGEEEDAKVNSLRIPGERENIVKVDEMRVERDATTGRITRVIESGDRRRPNPLGDPLNDLDSNSSSESERDEEMPDQHRLTKSLSTPSGIQPKTAVVQKLEKEAQRPEKKYQPKQSNSERAFVEALVEKYDDDYERMARDIKINYMQRSAGDLKRRVRRWRDGRGEGGTG